MKTPLRIIIALWLFILSYQNSFSQNTRSLSERYILVVDVQQLFIKDKYPDSLARNFISSINLLIENTNPDKVIYIRSVTPILSISLKGFSVDTLNVSDFDERLKMVNDHIFLKTKGNSFTVKALDNYLRKNNARQVTVVGLAAEHCVYKTLLGGKKLGYEMLTVPEALLGITPEGKEKSIRKLLKKGIRALSMNEVIKTS